MKITYPDGSFQLTWEHCRAWYSPDGTLKDAEYKRWNNGTLRTTPVQARHTRVRKWLGDQGRLEVRTPYHASDVEAAKARQEDRKREFRLVLEGLRVGQMVCCPQDRGEPAYDAIVESIGEQINRNIHGTLFVWVTVRRNSGSSHVWPSHRLGGKIVEKELVE